jgi:hypothetical protein
MLSKMARGAFLLLLAVMIAAYALSAAKSEQPAPRDEQRTWRMYA